METNHNHNLLREAIARRATDTLSPRFTATTMQQIYKVAERRERRVEMWGYIAIVSMLILVTAGGVCGLYFMGKLPSAEEITTFFTNIKKGVAQYFTESAYYYYMALLFAILLVFDHKMRRKWGQRNSDLETDTPS
ncbi:MAG: hypothetical protein IJY36_00980 [Coprobacter sp.]|nr:hypothetical protein [Coprobacter sp.]